MINLETRVELMARPRWQRFARLPLTWWKFYSAMRPRMDRRFAARVAVGMAIQTTGRR